MCSVPVPALVSVITCPPAGAPWVTIPKAMLFGVTFTTGVPGGGAAPIPVNATDWGEFAASSLMTRDAVRWPAPTGENITAMLQLDPAGYAPEHALFTWKSARFAPLGSTEEICSDALPELVTVMF